MSEQYTTSGSCFWSLQVHVNWKFHEVEADLELPIFLWLRVLINVCAILGKVGQPCITSFQVMWANEWVKSAQDSQKVCTKLFSLPDNAKFLFPQLKFHSLHLTTSYGKKLTLQARRPHWLFWLVWLRGWEGLGKGSNFLESQQSEFTVFEVKSVIWPVDWM